LGLRPEKLKALLPVGAAAAIAAAFNTPLAAVLFALEAIVGDLHAPVLGSVVLASATSWGVHQIEILPVVSRADAHKLEGVVTLRDVLDSYGVGPP
jgi:CIC family chloride channel protein